MAKRSGMTQLPTKNGLDSPLVLLLVVAVLLGAMSVVGLIFEDWIYPTDELVQAFMVNDAVNLVVGLPSIFVSIGLVRRGNLVGLLFWPGALMYVLYNYIAYLFGMPFGWVTFVSLALVILSGYAMLDLIKRMDQNAIQTQLAGSVPERLSGWILALFGVAFLFRAAGIVYEAWSGQGALPVAEVGVLAADLVISVLWIIGGVSLLRKMPLGYASGLGLLYAACLLFLGLIVLLIFTPLFTSEPLMLVDVVVVSVMGLICFIPFGLFLRGVISTGKSPTS